MLSLQIYNLTSSVASWASGAFTSSVTQQIVPFVTSALTGNLQSIGIVALSVGVLGVFLGGTLQSGGEVMKSIGKPLIALGVILIFISLIKR